MMIVGERKQQINRFKDSKLLANLINNTNIRNHQYRDERWVLVIMSDDETIFAQYSKNSLLIIISN